MGSYEEKLAYRLTNRALDTPRSLRIAIIGADVSGIGLYIRLRHYVPSAAIQIYEKNIDVGGTWFENRYPGVACDIPSHVYQYTFEPNTQWSKFFSGGAEILEYVRGVAKKYEVREKVSFETTVLGMKWNEEKGEWAVKVRKGGEIETRSFDIVVNATGCLNNWKWPSIPGLNDFEGKLMHSANWDDSWDYSNKTVALIGAGLSAIQILPHLQKKCKDVFHFTRGRTWISEPFGGIATQQAIAGDKDSGNCNNAAMNSYSPEELKRFSEDSEYYRKYRKEIERFINLDHSCLFPGTPAAIDGQQRVIENMKLKLAKKPEIYKQLKPEFRPGCRRLTPGPGFLEALVEENVHFTNSPILKIMKDSISTADGKTQRVDGIVCATGFDTSFNPRFEVTGRNGILLSDQWKEYSSAYLSLAIPNFPNFFTIGGPNPATGGGSLLIIFASIIGYVVKAVQKIAREHIKSMVATQESLDEWEKYMDAYFPGTVHIEGCTSWYKAGETNHKVVGLWPGSSLHARKTLEHPRWEDFQYGYENDDEKGEDGKLSWLGDGWTVADREAGDTSWYLDEIDYPPVNK
ncbi:putative monooxygenase [Mollisia scopiformis]|uniref:Putative monooxygenase n=1 Tax=Mollisia scopiformis TaxID=149040 RepID=A0A194X0J1_MOLSC|nr:putative monooxygenase [Mollisia scopiformis]KUJ13710.1 putative monooxygenase [Mollisia scopiformis]